MYEMADDSDVQAMPDAAMVNAPAKVATTEDEKDPPQARAKLVSRILATIRRDKKHHEKAFKRMKRDMFVAMHGREEDWSEKNYKANIAGRHVKQKTASLYAKNPKAVAKRRDRLDFAIWDENPETLLAAFQMLQAGIAMADAYTAAAQAAPVAPADPLAAPVAPPADPMAALVEPAAPPLAGPAVTPGMPGGPLPPLQMPPGFDEAQALITDFQHGMERRKQIDKVGKTLEILFAQAMKEQKPVDFKTGMKQAVRRTCTTCVGYVELGFQREYGPRPGLTEQLSDAKARLDHIKRLMDEIGEGEIDDTAAEAAELEVSVAALQQEPEIIIREGLTFDYPRATKVIPDRLCKTLVGFIGARHLTIEYEYTVDEVKELFGVELKKYTNYTPDGKTFGEAAGAWFDEDGYSADDCAKNGGLVRVWKHFDKPSGLVYFVADGHKDFLREPAAPDVFVEDFWPVYAITFNEVENEDEVFPPSDVALLLDMQKEHNRSRQGKREHRDAARPRWGYANGAIEGDDIERIGKVKPFEAIGLNIDPSTELKKILQAFPVPGVDPNLYDTNEIFTDMQLVAGTSEANLGGIAKATATESAIAANSSATSDSSSVDDLDAFLTVIARAAGQILLREMSEEQVKEIVGPGAFWPHMTLAEIAGEVFLEVEAGSAGKPNQATEIRNWKEMLPFLIQMGSIKPIWLARETLRRLDDRMDLTDAVAEGVPSIVAMNQNKQPGPEDPGRAPDRQGPKGADKSQKPAEQGAGSGPAFGSNQV